MFPEPILRYSAINMPGTNIMVKSGLNVNSFYYFKLLNKFTKITGMDDSTDENFLKEFKYYNFNEYIENFENKETKLSEIITDNIDIDLNKTFNITNKNEK